MLTTAQMASFHENGYLVLENVLREDDLDDYATWRDRWMFALTATQGVKTYRWS